MRVCTVLLVLEAHNTGRIRISKYMHITLHLDRHYTDIIYI